MGFKCHLENRRVCIFIYSNNDFGISHASQVLNCSRDTKSHVQFWGNNFSSLTNLKNKAVMIKDQGLTKKGVHGTTELDSYDRGYSSEPVIC